jgi:hypothetical protein
VEKNLVKEKKYKAFELPHQKPYQENSMGQIHG